ncbi:hypothetical protein [Streptomyces avicenniae]|uniref:hypothetical protein n=1 Tax=Streptomyces avicenniae TaxID=500153 RepID=UPI00069C0E2F|nr:hypothetical protein [Streptomyces avicenniae]
MTARPLPRRCAYCSATAGALVAVARTGGPVVHACRPCRVTYRLMPLAAHPAGSCGALHHWPEAVPRELVARLADLGDAPQLRAVADRLFPAVAAAASRVVACRDRGAATIAVHAAVLALWVAVREAE